LFPLREEGPRSWPPISVWGFGGEWCPTVTSHFSPRFANRNPRIDVGPMQGKRKDRKRAHGFGTTSPNAGFAFFGGQGSENEKPVLGAHAGDTAEKVPCRGYRRSWIVAGWPRRAARELDRLEVRPIHNSTKSGDQGENTGPGPMPRDVISDLQTVTLFAATAVSFRSGGWDSTV